MSGYSGTPLAQKLGIKQGARVCAPGAPANYRQLLAPLPPGVKFVRSFDDSTDLLHLFARQRAALEAALRSARASMRPDAVIWVSWPKKSSPLAGELSEDLVRTHALPLGLVDIKVCAVDDTWSGLKLMLRKSERPQPPVRGSTRRRSAA